MPRAAFPFAETHALSVVFHGLILCGVMAGTAGWGEAYPERGAGHRLEGTSPSLESAIS